MAEIRIVSEGELEAVNCEECGEANVITGAAHGCKNCAWWLELIADSGRKEEP